jgi:ATP-dependent DNA helicase RecG
VTDIQANQLLEELIYLPRETEWLEFKKNSGSVNNDEIGEYLSALSNGACIKNEPFGYLMSQRDGGTDSLIIMIVNTDKEHVNSTT